MFLDLAAVTNGNPSVIATTRQPKLSTNGMQKQLGMELNPAGAFSAACYLIFDNGNFPSTGTWAQEIINI